jgi:hypothetical protein
MSIELMDLIDLDDIVLELNVFWWGLNMVGYKSRSGEWLWDDVLEEEDRLYLLIKHGEVSHVSD